MFVQPAVLTPTHRCQRYSVRRASCLQATAAPAPLWLFTLPALTSALFPHRKQLSYPSSKFEVYEAMMKKKKTYPSARFLFDSTGSVRAAAKFGPYLSFFRRHQSVLGWIPAEEGLPLSCQHYCDRICKSCLEAAWLLALPSSTCLNCFETVFVRRRTGGPPHETELYNITET